jgi:hypothetical protein
LAGSSEVIVSADKSAWDFHLPLIGSEQLL